MNLEPDNILQPMGGNNANARASAVRIMNQQEPTPRQFAELMHKFDLHRVKLRTGIVGLLTSQGELSDGSPFRIVSNSGLHTIMLWPIGGAPEPVALADWFRAIPASDTSRSGTGTHPSWGWKFPKKLADLDGWPTKHKALSLRVDHPGHVTWCNPDLTLDKKPIVLSWRGPRDRYAATTGMDGATSGSNVAHERNPANFPSSSTTLQLAEDVLKDGPYVWMHGHKIDTGIPKVIAACLHQYDPSGHPGQFVMRVCADRTIASSTRQMVVYDLVPKDGADGGSLESFAKAKTLHVKATYAAADQTNNANPGTGAQTPGKWDYWQRPHFNKSGTRLATLICKVGTDGTSRESWAVSFDPTTWVLDDQVQATIVATHTSDFLAIYVDWTQTISDEQRYFIACDFEGDTFVYADLKVKRETTEHGRDDGSATDIEGGAVRCGYYDISDQYTYTISHSILGQLKQWVVSSAFSISYGKSSLGGGSYTASGSMSWTITNGWAASVTQRAIGAVSSQECAFFGDLSKRTFAVGYPEQDVASYSASGTLSSTTYTSPTPPPQIPVEATRKRTFLVFDVYFDGTKILDAANGGFANEAAEITSGSYDDYLGKMFPIQSPRDSTTNVLGQIARYGVPAAGTSLGPPAFEGRWSTSISRAAHYNWTAAPQHHHCAVHPEKAAAYFGAAYFKDNTLYGGSTPLPHGLELFVVKLDTTPATENPEAFITGDHPTLSAPVFSGYSLASGEIA